MNPKLIVFEGIDGSGKSSLVQSLTEKLNQSNFKFKNFSEPTKYEHGLKIREFLQNKIFLSKSQQIELFLKDRKDSIFKNINPNLDSGFHVILDRYFYSMAAYQSDENFSAEKIIQLNLDEKFLIPDFVFYLEIDPKIALSRTSNRGESEFFENLDELTKVANEYKKILPKDTIYVDAEKSGIDVQNFCYERILSILSFDNTITKQ